jgi:hypothetical protein
MTRNQILAAKRPEDIFPGNEADAKRLYRELSKLWHPDMHGGSTEVFAHLSELYRLGLQKLSKGLWEQKALLKFITVNGTVRELPVLAGAPFALGRDLISPDLVTFLIDGVHKPLFENALAQKFKFANDRMQAETQRYLPDFCMKGKLKDGRLLLQAKKSEDLIRLRDVVTYMGLLEAKHSAWIISSLLNLACYLSYTGIVHHDISPDTYFISPEFHSGALLGGWWYAQPKGGPVKHVPKRTFALMPYSARIKKEAQAATDLELIRATGREITASTIPVPMMAWLTKVDQRGAVEQYKEWQEVLKASFGERRYVKMAVTAEAVYTANGRH